MRARVKTQLLVDQHRRGATVRELSRLYRIAPSTIYGRFRIAGYRPGGQQLNLIRWAARATRDLEDGATARATADRSGIAVATLYYRLAKIGFCDRAFSARAYRVHLSWEDYTRHSMSITAIAHKYGTSTARLRRDFVYFGYTPRPHRISRTLMRTITRVALTSGVRFACRESSISVAAFCYTARRYAEFSSARAVIWRAYLRQLPRSYATPDPAGD